MRTFFLLIVCFYSALLVSAQDPIRFSLKGSSRMESRLSFSDSSNYALPEDYFRWHMQTDWNLWGLPVQSSWLISTEQKSYQQSMNQFRFSIRYQDFLKSAVVRKLPWLKVIRQFSLGRSYPSFSRLTFSGVALDGLQVEMDPGFFYVAYAEGQLKRAVFESGYPVQPFSRRARYIRAGPGGRNGNHLHVAFLNVRDKRLEAAGSLRPAFPAENYVTALDAQIHFFKNKLSIKGEGAVSLFTENQEGPAFAEGDLPEFVVNRFHPNLTSFIDYAWQFESEFKAGTSRINAFYRMINPGFKSLGVGIMRTDYSEYGFSWLQYLYKRRVSFKLLTSRNLDNLYQTKTVQSTAWRYGFHLNMLFPDLPHMHISYSPLEQYRETPVSTSIYQVRLFQVRTNHSWTAGKNRFTAALGYLRQGTLTGMDEDKLGRRSSVYSFSQSCLMNQWVLTLHANWNHMLYGDDRKNLIGGSVLARYSLTKNMQVNLGYQRFQSLSADCRNRLQAGFTADLGSWGSLELTGEYYAGTRGGDSQTSYTDFVFRMNWQVRF